MQVSTFCAQLLGPMFIVLGIALLLKPGMFRDMLPQLIGSPLWLYFGGVLGLLVGLVLVLLHNVWVADWRIIITLFGWSSLIRALITIFKPQWVIAAGEAILRNYRGIFVVAGVADLLIGFVLTFFGYTA